MKKLSGFTLAEILIAMTILGIVCALTIPYISTSTTRKQHVTTLKQTMSMLQGAAPSFKLAGGGYDYTGNRAKTAGTDTIGNILQQQLGAQRLMLPSDKQWKVFGTVADGYEILSKEQFNGTNSVQIEHLLTDAAKKVNGEDIDDPFTIEFGHSDAKEEYKAANGNYGNTYKLSNGAYVFVNNNSIGCNLENVRWDSSNYAYVTPDVTVKSNSNTNLCLAFIDVNGPKGPNRITGCSAIYTNNITENTKVISPYSTTSCKITEKEIADVYPIFFYDSSVAPANNATYALLHDLAGDE